MFAGDLKPIASASKIKKYGKKFFQRMVDVLGDDLDRVGHPLRSAFEVYVEMMEDGRSESDEDDDDESA